MAETGLGWMDQASDTISNIALNLTRQFATNHSVAAATATCPLCVKLGAQDWAALKGAYRHETFMALKRIASQEQMFLRVQLDPGGSAPLVQEYARKFIEQDLGVLVSTLPTPPFSQAAVDYTHVSVAAADIRWADVSGQGTDPISDPDRTHLFQPFFMYYRSDVLAGRNMSVPSTWEGLLAAARYLNGTDLDGDGEADYALCFNPNYHCQQAYMLLAVFSSMLQTQPKQHPRYSGVWLNRSSSSLEPLVDNAAMQRALQLYVELSKHNHPVGEDVCLPHSQAFSDGKCAFAFNMEQYRLLTQQASSFIYGKLGTALCPGSPYVLDPPSNTLLPCNASLCPLSYTAPDPARGPRINRAPLNLAIRTHHIDIQSTTVQTTSVQALAGLEKFFQYMLMDWSNMYVGPVLAALHIRMPPPGASAITAASPPATPYPSQSRNTPSPLPPARLPAAAAGGARNGSGRRLLAVGAKGNASAMAIVGYGVAGWTYDATPLLELGYHLHDTVGFLKGLQLAWQHPNTVMDIFVPGSMYFRLALAEAATNATNDPAADLAAITATLAAHFRLVVGKFSGAASMRALYDSCMGAQQPGEGAQLPSTAAAAAASAAGKHSNRSVGYIAAAVAVVSAVALALVAAFVLRARVQGRTLLGSVIAPLTGASTTLLITDIQNSTMMWEQLPMALMEEVLRVHHSVLRGLLDKHRGYESATEGDSFVLAFHSAHDALEYAVEAQRALLAADWPQQLLDTFPAAAAIRLLPVKGNTEVELSYIIRRLQGLEAPLVHIPFRSTPLMRSLAPTAPTTLGRQPPLGGSTHVPVLQTRVGKRLLQLWGQGMCLLLRAPKQRRSGLGQVPSPNAHHLHVHHPTDTVEGDEGGAAEAISISTAAAHGPCKGGCTFGQALSQAWTQHDGGGSALPARSATLPAAAASTLTFRGVRVRVGIHSGLSDPLQVAYNRASRRTQYTGAFAETAKLVVDAAHGGQVLLSESAFAQLKAEDKAAGMIMCLGEYELGGQLKAAAVPLYQASPRMLAARLPCFPPLRAVRAPLLGVLEAPVGTASIVFMKATGVATLSAWDAAITKAALQLYHSTVTELVPQYSGYIVEMAEELSLLAFQRPEAAIAWALAARERLLAADWPQELLEHELCEPITTTLVAAAADSSRLVRSLAVHSRGLRLKVGVAQGRVVDSVNEATGHMAYRGKVMNRAARIASAASTGQVLVHYEAWAAAEHSLLTVQQGITATTTGLHSMKGIRQPTELFSCTYISQGALLAKRRASMEDSSTSLGSSSDHLGSDLVADGEQVQVQVQVQG